LSFPGLLGFVWLIVWRRFYSLPQDHPRITAAEREMILSENVASGNANARPPSRWGDLLKLPQTWGTIVSKALTDPVCSLWRIGFRFTSGPKGISPKSGFIAFLGSFLLPRISGIFLEERRLDS